VELRVLFWNVDKKPRYERIARLVQTNRVDLLLLAEWKHSVLKLIRVIGQNCRIIGEAQNGMLALAILPELEASLQVSTLRFQIYAMNLRECDFQLSLVHFPSKRSPEDTQPQATEARNLVRQLAHPDATYNRNSIVIGDFNMNPFEQGMVASDALNSASSVRAVWDESRVVRSMVYPQWYNPMWSFFGDRSPGQPGTYYYNTSSDINFYWNIFDQVLLRAEIANSLVDVSILDTDGVESLLTVSGLPDRTQASDHLPLLVTLNPEKMGG
jgi:exonuclease III